MRDGVDIAPHISPTVSFTKMWDIQIHLEQAEIIHRIFGEYLSGINVEEIAAGLRKDNVPNRSGRPAWSSTGIRYILSNEKYIGDSQWQKYYTTTSLPFQSKVNHGEVDSYYVRSTHQGIITPEEFRAANLLMKQRREKIMPPSLHSHAPV
ncbi:MAG: recombinase family protein [Flavonifractor plautii]